MNGWMRYCIDGVVYIVVEYLDGDEWMDEVLY